MIDRFSKQDFEQCLEWIISGDIADKFPKHVTVLPMGLNGGEYTYRLPLTNDGWLHVRSSVGISGAAAEAGEDSIRLWVGDVSGRPYLGKKQAWVTRQMGWRDRLYQQASVLLDEWHAQGELLSRMRKSAERTMMSKYDGWCKACKQKFAEGTPIALRDIGGDKPAWVHFECPIKPGVKATLSTGSVTALDAISEAVGAVGLSPEAQAEALGALADFFAASPVTIDAAPSAPAVEFVPSRYQTDIFRFIDDVNAGNAVVEAVAGSGKTTTLVHALSHVKPDVKAAFLAFNKHIAKTLKDKQEAGEIPAHIQVRTVHSLGMANLTRAFKPSADFVDSDKLSTIMNGFPQLSRDRYLPSDIRAANIARRQFVSQLVSLCKGTMVNALTESLNTTALYAMIEHYGIEADGFGDAELSLVPEILRLCATNVNVIDFDDMVWLPVQLGIELEKFDLLLVDEAQDLNAVQIELILRSLAPNGRIIAVGDRHQSLYGFRGADTEAIPRLIKALNATVLPLSITYRCPTSHVQLAQRIVPAIEARPNAPEGLVATIDIDEVAKIATDGDLIICRTNAPLVPMAYALIKRGVKAMVKGRDIGIGLSQLVDKFQSQNLGELAANMRDYLDRETIRMSQADKWEQLQQLTDKMETIHAVMSECRSVPDLKGRLERLFSDNVSGVVLSSVHRAKGSEANRVFILRPDLLPHPSAKQAWQKVQEQNGMYVAYTRSLNELLFVEGDNG